MFLNEFVFGVYEVIYISYLGELIFFVIYFFFCFLFCLNLLILVLGIFFFLLYGDIVEGVLIVSIDGFLVIVNVVNKS